MRLCWLAFAVAAVDPFGQSTYPSVDILGAPVPGALAALSLRLSPHYTSILSLYVVLLLLAVPAVLGLARFRTLAVAAGSVVQYSRLPVAVDLHIGTARHARTVNWASWQPPPNGARHPLLKAAII